jgi:hypothetical protein
VHACTSYYSVSEQAGSLTPIPIMKFQQQQQLSYRNPPPNHDCENMDMPAVVTPSVNVTDMACVGHVVYNIAFPQLCGLTPTFAWLYIHMSVTRWDVTPTSRESKRTPLSSRPNTCDA